MLSTVKEFNRGWDNEGPVGDLWEESGILKRLQCIDLKDSSWNSFSPHGVFLCAIHSVTGHESLVLVQGIRTGRLSTTKLSYDQT